jgi:hypothetical protein
MNHPPPTRPLGVALAVLLLGATGSFAAPEPSLGEAIGTITFQDQSVTLRHAYLVAGEYNGNPVRKVILSAVDIEDAIVAARSMVAASALLREGITFAFDESVPYVRTWVAIADQSLQKSSAPEKDLFTTTVDSRRRIAGSVAFDESASYGAKVEASFNAELIRSFE